MNNNRDDIIRLGAVIEHALTDELPSRDFRTPCAEHDDDRFVDLFANAMKAKLADSRRKGRAGWQTCDPVNLSIMLREHVEKGDPRDVANFCMFLWVMDQSISKENPWVQKKR